MMKSLEKINSTSDEIKYIKYISGRLNRLWPEMMVAIIAWILFYILKGNISTIDDLLEFIPAAFMFGKINNFGGIGTLWYVAALFWGQVLIGGIVIFRKDKSLILSIIFFMGISFMFASYSGLSLNSNPLVGNVISAGLIKSITDLSLGALLWIYVCWREDEVVNSYKYRWLYMIIEWLSIIGIAYCFYKGENCKSNYLIYPFATIILFLVLRQRAYICKLLAQKYFTSLGKYCYATYCIHTLVMEIAITLGMKDILIWKYSQIVVYGGGIIVSFLCVIFIHKITFIIKRLYKY